MRRLAVLAVGAALVLAACEDSDTTEPDGAGGQAMCDHFGQTFHPDMSTDERADLVRDLQGIQIPGDQSRIGRYLARYDAIGYLERTVDSAAWKTGADLFAATCFDAGWQKPE